MASKKRKYESWTAGVEVEVSELDMGLERTAYHLTFRWNTRTCDGKGLGFSEELTFRCHRNFIPANLQKGEWASHAQAVQLLRCLIKTAREEVVEEYLDLVKCCPRAAV